MRKDEASLEDVIQQLLFITSLPNELLVKWSNNSRDPVVSSGMGDDEDDETAFIGRRKQSREDFTETLTYIYHELGFLEQALAGANKDTGNEKNLEIITTALSDKACDPSDEHNKTRGLISNELVPLFIRASQVFSDLETGSEDGSGDGDMAPFAYRLAGLASRPAWKPRIPERVLQSLGARNNPSLEQVQSWTRSMYMDHFQRNKQ